MFFFYITKNVEGDNLTRYELYRNAYKAFPTKFKVGRNYIDIKNSFKYGAQIIKNMEPLLLDKNFNQTYEKFMELFDSNKREISDEKFNNMLNKMEKYKLIHRKRKKNCFKYLFNSLINIISTYQSQLINDSDIVLKDTDAEELNNHSIYNKVFLSYAMKDKGLTLSLFYYFLNNGVFLFVDWMQNDKGRNGKEIKQNLEKALKTSDQLLFLRTINSELEIQGGSSIRQWCAWEIGNYYTKKCNEKFYINFYENKQNNNQMLDSFKLMDNISNKKIIPSSNGLQSG